MITSPDIVALTAALDEARQDVRSASAEYSAAPWDDHEGWRMARTRFRAMQSREEVARVALVRAEGRIAAAATRARRAGLIAAPTLSQLHAAALPLVTAQDSRPATTALRRALEEVGIRPTAALAQQLAQLLPARIARRRARAKIRLAAKPAKVPLPYGTISDRLDLVRKRAVRAAALQVLRDGPRTSITVSLGGEPGISLATDTCRPYGGRWKTWSAQEQDYTITVPADWRRTVEARGLADVAGALTLAAMPVVAPVGIEAADCLVAVPSRGYEVRTERRLYARVERSAWVHIRPQALAPTISDIRAERNTEIRAIMIAAYGGTERYLAEAGARTIHRDETGELIRLGSGAAAITAVRLTCPTTGRVYVERVPPTMTTAREAVAWQFGLRAEQYQPEAQS